MRQTLIQAAAKKYQTDLFQKALGMEAIEKDKKMKQSKRVFESNILDIKKELKQSIKKTYSSGIGELVTRIELLAELFQELDQTLIDLDKERVGKKNNKKISKHTQNYLDLTLQQLRKLRGQSLLQNFGFNLAALAQGLPSLKGGLGSLLAGKKKKESEVSDAVEAKNRHETSDSSKKSDEDQESAEEDDKEKNE